MKPKQCSKEHFKVCQDVDELNENIYSLRNGLGMINNHKHFKEEKNRILKMIQLKIMKRLMLL